jgi:hypothetical protein
MESMTMWGWHLRYTLTALAFGLAVSGLPWTGTAAADSEAERALARFKAKAEQFQHFFAQNPMILSKQDFTQSPTGKSYSHVRLTLLDSGFDVQRTNSLVSPFIGYLSLTCVAENTDTCGDIIIYSKTGREKVQRDVYGSNMARTSFTSVGSEADSPEPLLRPSAAMGHDAEILDVLDPDLGYDAENSVSAAPRDDAIHISCRAIGRVRWKHLD